MAAFCERYHKRIKHDLTELYADPVDGIYVVQDETLNNKVHALVIGPKDTPYDGGFFYFIFTYPEKYPLKPPAVKFMTTGDGKVRFNPNLYSSGKVCLSILGTWTGPGWTSVMTTKSVLISIQSLIMNEAPFFNEPGFENMKTMPDGKVKSDAYNARISYEKMRVAVIDMINSCQTEKLSMPSVLKEMAIKLFQDNYERYQTMLATMTTDTSAGRRGDPMLSGFLMHDSKPLVAQNYDDLKTRLTALYSTLQASKREDSYATQLYDSLREAYTGVRSVKYDLDTQQMVEELANEALSSDEDDCILVDSDSDDQAEVLEDDDEVQVVNVVAPTSNDSNSQPPKQD